MTDDGDQPGAERPTLRKLLMEGGALSDVLAKQYEAAAALTLPVQTYVPMPNIELPDVVAARRLRETNELLAQMVEILRADAARAREDAERAGVKTTHALVAAWVAVGVTVVVGLVQIVVALASGG